MKKKWLLIAGGLFFVFMIIGSMGDSPTTETVETSTHESNFGDEIVLVTSALTNEVDLGLDDNKFKAVENPIGEGIVVYYPETRFNEVERILLWLAHDDVAYPLNGASKDVTPNLKWLREADEEVINKSGLNPYQVDDEIMAIVTN